MGITKSASVVKGNSSKARYNARAKTVTRTISVKNTEWAGPVELELTLDFSGVGEEQLADWASRTLTIQVQQVLRGKSYEFVKQLAKTGLKKKAAESMVIEDPVAAQRRVLEQAERMSPEALAKLIAELQAKQRA